MIASNLAWAPLGKFLPGMATLELWGLGEDGFVCWIQGFSETVKKGVLIEILETKKASKSLWTTQSNFENIQNPQGVRTCQMSLAWQSNSSILFCKIE